MGGEKVIFKGTGQNRTLAVFDITKIRTTAAILYISLVASVVEKKRC